MVGMLRAEGVTQMLGFMPWGNKNGMKVEARLWLMKHRTDGLFSCSKRTIPDWFLGRPFEQSSNTEGRSSEMMSLGSAGSQVLGLHAGTRPVWPVALTNPCLDGTLPSASAGALLLQVDWWSWPAVPA